MTFRLAAHLRKTVAELRASMDSSEFVHWFAYARIEPFGEKRMDDRFALLAAQIARFVCGRGAGSLTPDKLGLKYEGDASAKPAGVVGEGKNQSVDFNWLVNQLKARQGQGFNIVDKRQSKGDGG